MTVSHASGAAGGAAFIRNALVLAFGLVIGFVLGGLVLTPSQTQAAGRNQYKVERAGAREPAVLQELLDQRAEEGWLLQALDHETVIFRRAPAPRRTPAPTPEQ